MKRFLKYTLIVSLFVLCALALTVLGASAATPPSGATTDDGTSVAKIEVSSVEYFYTDLNTAVTDALDNSAGTVTVLKDTTVTTQISITGDLTITAASSVNVTNSTGGALFAVSTGKVLTVADTVVIDADATDAVASVSNAGSTAYYTTIKAAADNGAAGQPITVLKNYTMSAAIAPSRDLTIVGKTADITITTANTGTNTVDRFYEATSGTRSLTLRDLTFVGTTQNLFLSRSSANVTYNFDNVTINSPKSLFYCDGSSTSSVTIANSTVTVSSGTMFSFAGTASATTLSLQDVVLHGNLIASSSSGTVCTPVITYTTDAKAIADGAALRVGSTVGGALGTVYFKSLSEAVATAPAGSANAFTTIYVIGNSSTTASATTTVTGKYIKITGLTGNEKLSITNGSVFVITVGDGTQLLIENVEISCGGRFISIATTSAAGKATVTLGNGAWLHAENAGGSVNAMIYVDGAKRYADITIDTGAKIGFDAFTSTRNGLDLILIIQELEGDITIRGEVYSNVTSSTRVGLLWCTAVITGAVNVENTATISLAGTVAANSAFIYATAEATNGYNIYGNPTAVCPLSGNWKIVYGMQGAIQVLDGEGGTPLRTIYVSAFKLTMKTQTYTSRLEVLQNAYPTAHYYRAFMISNAAGGYGGNLAPMTASGDIHILVTGDDPYTTAKEQYFFESTGYTHTSAPGGTYLFIVTAGADITFENIKIYRCGRFLTCTNENSANPSNIVLGDNTYVYGSPDINCMFGFSVNDSTSKIIYANLTIEEGAEVAFLDGWNNRNAQMIFAVTPLVGDITINGTLRMEFTSLYAGIQQMFASYTSNAFRGNITIGGSLIYDVTYSSDSIAGKVFNVSGNGTVTFKDTCSVFYRTTGANDAACAFYGYTETTGYMPDIVIEGGTFDFKTGYGFLLNSARPNGSGGIATHTISGGTFTAGGVASIYVGGRNIVSVEDATFLAADTSNPLFTVTGDGALKIISAVTAGSAPVTEAMITANTKATVSGVAYYGGSLMSIVAAIPDGATATIYLLAPITITTTVEEYFKNADRSPTREAYVNAHALIRDKNITVVGLNNGSTDITFSPTGSRVLYGSLFGIRHGGTLTLQNLKIAMTAGMFVGFDNCDATANGGDIVLNLVNTTLTGTPTAYLFGNGNSNHGPSRPGTAASLYKNNSVTVNVDADSVIDISFTGTGGSSDATGTANGFLICYFRWYLTNHAYINYAGTLRVSVPSTANAFRFSHEDNFGDLNIDISNIAELSLTVPSEVKAKASTYFMSWGTCGGTLKAQVTDYAALGSIFTNGIFQPDNGKDPSDEKYVACTYRLLSLHGAQSAANDATAAGVGLIFRLGATGDVIYFPTLTAAIDAIPTGGSGTICLLDSITVTAANTTIQDKAVTIVGRDLAAGSYDITYTPSSNVSYAMLFFVRTTVANTGASITLQNLRIQMNGGGLVGFYDADGTTGTAAATLSNTHVTGSVKSYFIGTSNGHSNGGAANKKITTTNILIDENSSVVLDLTSGVGGTGSAGNDRGFILFYFRWVFSTNVNVTVNGSINVSVGASANAFHVFRNSNASALRFVFGSDADFTVTIAEGLKTALAASPNQVAFWQYGDGTGYFTAPANIFVNIYKAGFLSVFPGKTPTLTITAGPIASDADAILIGANFRLGDTASGNYGTVYFNTIANAVAAITPGSTNTLYLLASGGTLTTTLTLADTTLIIDSVGGKQSMTVSANPAFKLDAGGQLVIKNAKIFSNSNFALIINTSATAHVGIDMQSGAEVEMKCYSAANYFLNATEGTQATPVSSGIITVTIADGATLKSVNSGTGSNSTGQGLFQFRLSGEYNACATGSSITIGGTIDYALKFASSGYAPVVMGGNPNLAVRFLDTANVSVCHVNASASTWGAIICYESNMPVTFEGGTYSLGNNVALMGFNGNPFSGSINFSGNITFNMVDWAENNDSFLFVDYLSNTQTEHTTRVTFRNASLTTVNLDKISQNSAMTKLFLQNVSFDSDAMALAWGANFRTGATAGSGYYSSLADLVADLEVNTISGETVTRHQGTAYLLRDGYTYSGSTIEIVSRSLRITSAGNTRLTLNLNTLIPFDLFSGSELVLGNIEVKSYQRLMRFRYNGTIAKNVFEMENGSILRAMGGDGNFFYVNLSGDTDEVGPGVIEVNLREGSTLVREARGTGSSLLFNLDDATVAEGSLITVAGAVQDNGGALAGKSFAMFRSPAPGLSLHITSTARLSTNATGGPANSSMGAMIAMAGAVTVDAGGTAQDPQFTSTGDGVVAVFALQWGTNAYTVNGRPTFSLGTKNSGNFSAYMTNRQADAISVRVTDDWVATEIFGATIRVGDAPTNGDYAYMYHDYFSGFNSLCVAVTHTENSTVLSDNDTIYLLQTQNITNGCTLLSNCTGLRLVYPTDAPAFRISSGTVVLYGLAINQCNTFAEISGTGRLDFSRGVTFTATAATADALHGTAMIELSGSGKFYMNYHSAGAPSMTFTGAATLDTSYTVFHTSADWNGVISIAGTILYGWATTGNSSIFNVEGTGTSGIILVNAHANVQHNGTVGNGATATMVRSAAAEGSGVQIRVLNPTTFGTYFKIHDITAQDANAAYPMRIGHVTPRHQYTASIFDYPWDVVCVNVTWGDLGFTYTRGMWNPVTHTYGEGTWAVNQEGGDKITVTNVGDVVVRASVSFTPANGYSMFGGAFTENGVPVSGSVLLTSPNIKASGATKEFTFSLSTTGSPADMQNQAVGSITVTITANDRNVAQEMTFTNRYGTPGYNHGDGNGAWKIGSSNGGVYRSDGVFYQAYYGGDNLYGVIQRYDKNTQATVYSKIFLNDSVDITGSNYVNVSMGHLNGITYNSNLNKVVVAPGSGTNDDGTSWGGRYVLLLDGDDLSYDPVNGKIDTDSSFSGIAFVPQATIRGITYTNFYVCLSGSIKFYEEDFQPLRVRDAQGNIVLDGENKPMIVQSFATGMDSYAEVGQCIGADADHVYFLCNTYSYPFLQDTIVRVYDYDGNLVDYIRIPIPDAAPERSGQIHAENITPIGDHLYIMGSGNPTMVLYKIAKEYDK